MISSKHQIRNLAFEFKSEGLVFGSDNEEIYTQVSNCLLPVIEEVFDLSVFSDYQIRLKKLYLDLGTVSIQGESLEPAASKLKKLLEEQLRKKVNTISNNDYAAETVIPVRQANIINLFHFLQNGFFNSAVSMTPDQLLNDIITNDLSLFIIYLRKYARTESVLKRLIWQFDITLLEKVLKSFDASEETFYTGFIARTKATRIISYPDKDLVIESSPITYYRQILEFTFHYLLSLKKVQFNKTDFAYSILLKISNHYNIDIGLLIKSLFSVSYSPDIVSDDSSEILKILTRIHKKYVPSSKERNHPNRSFGNSSIFLLNLLYAGNDSLKVIQLWNRMHSMDKEGLRSFLFLRLQNRLLIRNLVAAFDSTRLHQCIKLLNPQKWEYFSEIVTGSELFILKSKKSDPFLRPDLINHSQYINEFIVSYLLQKKDKDFSEKDFTRSILVNLANHHNLDYSSLLHTMYLFFKNNQQKENEFTGLYRVLSILCNEQAPVDFLNKLRPSKHVLKNQSIILLYENLKSFLFEGISGIEKTVYVDYENLEAVFRKIFKIRPDLIENLFYQIANNPAKIDIISRYHNNTRVFERLLSIYLKMKFGYPVNKKNALKQLTETLKNYHKNGIDYYPQVLSCLLSSSADDQRDMIMFVNGIINHLHTLKPGSSFENKDDFSESVTPSLNILIRYLYYFITHPSILKKNGFSRYEILRFFQDKYPQEFVREIISIFNENTALNRYANYSFILNDKTKNLLSEIADMDFQFLDHVCSYNFKLTNLHNKSDIFNKITQNIYRSDTIFQELTDSRSDLLFKFLKSNSNSGIISGFLPNTLLFKLIVYKPSSLLKFLIANKADSIVFNNLTDIITESTFYRLLHLIDNQNRIGIYNFFSSLQNIIYSMRSVEKTSFLIKKFQKVIIQNMLHADYQQADQSEIYSHITNTFHDILPDISQDCREQITMFAKRYSDNHKNTCTIGIQRTSKSEYCKENKNLSDKTDLNISPDPYNDKMLIDEIPVENAGIVIGAAYFERLFSMLELTENKKFKDKRSIHKALKILHYFVYNSTECWEHELILNKLLCGCDIACEIEVYSQITQSEKDIVNSLVNAILKNWPVMKNSSPQGFRESFLQRKGSLTRDENGWLLKVDNKSFDVLIDTLPWSLSMIRYPWMTNLLQVEWKSN